MLTTTTTTTQPTPHKTPPPPKTTLLFQPSPACFGTRASLPYERSEVRTLNGLFDCGSPGRALSNSPLPSRVPPTTCKASMRRAGLARIFISESLSTVYRHQMLLHFVQKNLVMFTDPCMQAGCLHGEAGGWGAGFEGLILIPNNMCARQG